MLRPPVLVSYRATVTMTPKKVNDYSSQNALSLVPTFSTGYSTNVFGFWNCMTISYDDMRTHFQYNMTVPGTFLLKSMFLIVK